MKHPTNHSRGFTLIEIMVVIAIIATLAAVGTPVDLGVLKKMEKHQFQVMMTALDNAFENFETEYNYLPYEGASYPTTDQWLDTSNEISSIITVLAGAESTVNFKKIKFIEGPVATGSGTTYKTGLHEKSDGTFTLYTPWGTEFIRMNIDHNMDGLVKIPWPVSEEAVGKYAIYDPGPDGQWGSWVAQNEEFLDNFTSYEDPR